MAIFAISDLHLSFNTDKPMNIFGWEDYEKIIEDDWKEKVTDNDLVLLPGDFSWEMKLENMEKDLEFIHKLPGKKLLLKGNHDYWWETLKKMREFTKAKGFDNIDFIYNNSYLFDNYIIAGTRGWTLGNENIVIENMEKSEQKNDDAKIRAREEQRLELSLLDGINKYGNDKKIIACLHYPPLTIKNKESGFKKILEKYNVAKCVYGHLHGKIQEEAIQGVINNVEYIMTSCDYLQFKLKKVV